MIIGIDMGHTVSGPNSGAIGYIKESEETRAVGNKVIYYLKQIGQTVINCTVDTASSNEASLSGRVSKANAQKLDLFLSIHFNSGGGKGTEIFTYNGVKYVEAVRILSNMQSIGFVNRGIKNGSSLYVIKNTKAKAMLLEVCFVDNKVDVEIYKANIDKIAIAIVEGITGQKVKEESGDFDMQDSVKTATCSCSPIRDKMVEEIKILQGVVGLNKDGIGTARLCKILPELTGVEQRGVVTVMQRILIIKEFLSKGSDTGIVGQANREAIARFKAATGIPNGNILVDFITWFKLIEY